ncbi:MAG: hypothetical protein PHG98_05030 [Bacteroidales bacterium]|jgi:hypothetical protein|nr:hypothetical protein [Bacteroidales bacterium]MDD4739298.1 hypothetical protein [Bacteroidales bacterium]
MKHYIKYMVGIRCKRVVKSELELMEDKKTILVERIKNIIIEMVHYSEEVLKTIFLIFSVKNSIMTILILLVFFMRLLESQ